MSTPLISCLCVTEDRPEFMPWLLWCFDRQSHPLRELVIVDSSTEPFDPGSRSDVRVITMPRGTTIARKRNRAIHEAHGDIITWFDDDDWQHPEKCALLADGGTRSSWSGCVESWFVNLAARTCTRFRNANCQGIFNSGGFRRDLIQ